MEFWPVGGIESGKTRFCSSWQGCSSGFPKGSDIGKSFGAALPAPEKHHPFLLWGPHSDLKHIYQILIRSLLEQASNKWHSGIAVECANDLERVQKIALKTILKEKYQRFENLLLLLDIETLKKRTTKLSLDFAKKCF